jgi:hypothetical protein
MIQACNKKNIPLSVNRYVWNNDELANEFLRIFNDHRFSGFILYETWSFIEFEKNGNCRISLPEYEPVVRMPDELWKAKSNTGRNVKKVLEIFKEKS